MYLFHVTFYNRLGAIAEHGLVPGRGRGIGGEIYDTHRQGAIFLTEADGIYFWGSKAEEWAQNQSDDLLEDGLAPVLLRIDTETLDFDYEDVCEEDEIGTKDARATAWKCAAVIPPADIEVWVGTWDAGEWLMVEDWNEIPVDDAFEVDSDGDEEWNVLKSPWGTPSPLIPVEDLYEAEHAEPARVRENNPKRKNKNRGGRTRSSLKNRLMR